MRLCGMPLTRLFDCRVNNRRAEGTSELNRRLGDGVKGDWALERCGAAGDYGRGCGGKQARCAGRWADWGAAGQQPSSAAGARGSGTAEARARPNVEVMVRRVTGPWNAAALPEIMAGALQESKRCVPVPFSEGRAVGQQPGSVAGARGGGTAEARARPNVEVNRRAEGTSELNLRLGAGAKGDWALERCGVAGDYGRGLAGKRARWNASSMCLNVPRRPSSRPATAPRRRSTRRWNGRSQSEA